MPVYDYICGSCGQVTEVIHRIDAPGPRFCPACGAEGTSRKAVASPTVHFKGSGWAKKDRSTASRTRSRTDADAGSGGKADRSGKTADGNAPAKDTAASDAKAGSGGSGGSDSGRSDSGPATSGSDAGSGKGTTKSSGSADD